MLPLSEIEEKLRNCNQNHLLSFWDELESNEQETLLKQLATIEFEKVNNVFQTAQKYLTEDTKKLDEHMKPIPPDQFQSENGVDPDILEKYHSRGLEEISESRVAVLLLAGGQGTRIGVSYPKGMYPLDLPSGKTLFQIQAERIRRILKIAKERTGKTGKICWYIMTSKATNSATAKYLEKHHYFGLNKEDVVLFQQGLLPCYTFDGKIILEEKGSVALAPDGNGGIYLALRKNKIIENMKSRGIKYVHVHSVDNILVRVADPTFIGYCVTKEADCGAKVVQKSSPTEAVGVICKVDGSFRVVEYSEITETTANLRDQEGNLVFRAGGEVAGLGQFPWMALLGYKQKQINYIEYLCGGTVITESYILTAAHCIGVGRNHQLVHVRLGEHNIKTSRDCVFFQGSKFCSDDPVDFPVQSHFRHPNYDSSTLKNDIALIRVKRNIEFTDFIQPICLPFERNLENKDLTNEKLWISGWGKTNSRNLGGSAELQFALVNVRNQAYCNQVVPPEVRPITKNQLCANGKKEDACKGDSGGPLSNATIGIDGELRNYQLGIVSFASTLTCGIEELPPVYTRVDQYLKWITDNVQ